jgi:hypothetical protein
VGGLVVVEGVPTGPQAVALVARDLGPLPVGAAGGAGPLAVGATRRRLALLLALTLVALAGSPPSVVVGLALLAASLALPGATPASVGALA